MPQWTLKKSIVNYMHKTVSECLVCGIGARVVPLRDQGDPLWNFWHVTQQSSPRLRDETVTVPVVLLYWL